ncbi:MAG: STAS domain-containing protein [Terriglobales bacterium]
MAIISALHKIDGDNVAGALHAALAELHNADDGKFILDFSSVRRVDPAALAALEQLATEADARAVRLVLSGVCVEVYKVLKLARLAARFTFR